jgi:hypothetical protein
VVEIAAKIHEPSMQFPQNNCRALYPRVSTFIRLTSGNYQNITDLDMVIKYNFAKWSGKNMELCSSSNGW